MNDEMDSVVRDTAPATALMVALAQEVNSLLEESARLEAEMKAAKTKALEIQRTTLPAMMRECGVETWGIEGGGKLTLKHIVRGSILADDRLRAFAAIRAAGHGYLIAEATVEEKMHVSKVKHLAEHIKSEWEAMDPATRPGTWQMLLPEGVQGREYDEVLYKAGK